MSVSFVTVHQGLILPTKILCSEKFSVKIRKLWCHQIFHRSLINYLEGVLEGLAYWKSKNVLKNSSIWTQFQILVSILRNVKICTEYREFFWYFWLVGLSPGWQIYLFKSSKWVFRPDPTKQLNCHLRLWWTRLGSWQWQWQWQCRWDVDVEILMYIYDTRVAGNFFWIYYLPCSIFCELDPCP